MRPTHYLSIAVAAALVAILYWGGTTVNPKKKASISADAPHAAGAEHKHNLVAEADSLIEAARRRLPEHGKEEVAALEKTLSATSDSGKMLPVLDQLADVWREHRQPIPAVHYRAVAARLANSPEKLTFAGRSALGLLESPEVPPNARHWAGETAVDLFTRALAQRPEVDTLQLALAVAYIEGTGETMQGVQQLLAITRKTPNHVPANLLLGRMSVQSGQWDKAAVRFQTVLDDEPRNVEALLGLADTYRGKGEKEKAVELFEKAKRTVNNPDFSRDIDAYIQTFSKQN